MSFLGSFLDAQRAKLNEIIETILEKKCDDEDCLEYEIIFVLCNEASDLDSLICCLLWAHFNQYQYDMNMNKNKTQTLKLYIPLFGMKRNELRLRKDCIHLFNEIDPSLIKKEKFFFLDNIPFYTLITLSHLNGIINTISSNNSSSSLLFKLNVHLVDHNEISIYLHEYLKDYVSLIIDHHKDKGLYLETVKTENRYLDIVGVNVVFVIEIIDKLNECKYDIDREFGILINGAILLDLGAFDESLKKTTNRDMMIFKRFEKYNLNKDYKIWHKELEDLRCNQNGFTLNDLLKMDLKVFRINDILFSISCLYQEIKDKKSIHLFQQIELFQNEKKLDFVIVLLTYNKMREFGLFCNKNEKLFNHLTHSLQELSIKNTLNDIMIDTESKTKWYYSWYALDYSVSRKRLDPIIRDILKNYH